MTAKTRHPMAEEKSRYNISRTAKHFIRFVCERGNKNSLHFLSPNDVKRRMLRKRLSETNGAEFFKFDLFINVTEDLKGKTIHRASV